MLDLLIVGGRVITGASNPWFYGDVGIEGDRIAAVGRLHSAEARRVIDAGGLVVTPGFIDIHTHTDLSVYHEPELRAKVMQGVTTEIEGNCGFSVAPCTAESLDGVHAHWKGLFGEEALSWLTVDDYFSTLEQQGVSVNVATFVGHVTLRTVVTGDEDRPLTTDELEAMKELLAQGMSDGAVGLSTGLIYRPGSYATTEELVELTRVVGEFGGLYASHIRGERETLLKAIEEIISIGEQTGVPVHVSHLKAVSRENWGKVEEALRLLEEARARGIDITYDAYAFRGAPVKVWSGMVPPWAREGTFDDIRERFSDARTRQAITAEAPPQNWSTMFVVRYGPNPGWIKRYMTELAREQGTTPLELAMDMFVADPDFVLVQTDCMSGTDVRRTVSHPLGMVSSDASLHTERLPHPRTYTAFAEVLHKFVREERVIPLEEAIRRMTSAPAQRLGFKDLGLLREGMKADIVVLDPERVRSRATYLDPEQHPEGIEYVLVSGQVTVERGTHTGAKEGKVLRRPGASLSVIP